ncbi:MAG: sporulation protein YqfD [Clostridia bacterium]
MNKAKIKVNINQISFLDIIAEKNLEVFNVKVEAKCIIFEVDFLHYKKIINTLKEYGFTYKILSKKGVQFNFKSINSYIGAIVGVFVLICFCFVSNMFVFKVEIVGNKNVDSNKILKVLAQNGIKPLTKKVSDTKKLEKAIQNIDGVSFAVADYKGVTLKIEVKEELFFENINEDKKEKIVASKDGIITKIIVQSGTAKVKRGDLVKRGDVLIAGEQIVDEEKKLTANVGASGEVFAKVYYHKRFILPKESIIFVPTGKSVTKTDFCFLNFASNKKFDKYKYFQKTVNEVAFNAILPIKLTQTTYYELENKLIDSNLLAPKLENDMKHKILEQLDKNAVILKNWTTKKTLDNLLYFDIYYEVEECISK